MKKLYIAMMAAFLFAVGLYPAGAQEKSITVFAAASMKDALDSAAQKYEEMSGIKVVVSFASSSVLAKQIEQGAPADAYVSADVKWMDYLADKKLIVADTRRVIAGNDLVIAAPADTKPVSDPQSFLAKDKFAMGDPRHVPAGIYAHQALENLGVWESLKGNAVFGENVRVALEYAIRGETNAAIVYGSDLYAAPELAPVYRFPDDSHPKIRYPAAVINDGKKEAVKFLDFLSGDSGQTTLVSFGFAKAEK